jgi:hypothetical protein
MVGRAVDAVLSWIVENAAPHSCNGSGPCVDMVVSREFVYRNARAPDPYHRGWPFSIDRNGIPRITPVSCRAPVPYLVRYRPFKMMAMA